MRNGSVVRLSRPHSINSNYTDALGVVIRIYGSPVTNESVCSVRFMDDLDSLAHMQLEIYTHRLDLIKE